MSIVLHLHHLFNPETCQAYIHTLRWKDRPLQCPRCQSLNVGSWGTYHAQPGLKRYRCIELVITQNFSVCERSERLQLRHARCSSRARAFAIPASHLWSG